MDSIDHHPVLITVRCRKSLRLPALLARSFILAFVLLLEGALAQAQAGIALVQHTSKDAGSTTSSSLAFVSANTAGNWIGVVIRAGKSGQVFTVTDNRGNTYHKAVQFNVTVDAPGGDTLGIFYAENIAGGANTITVSDTISGTLRFAILEYSGVAPANSLDGTAATAQGTSASPNSGNVITTANGDLLLGAILTANPASFTTGNGYTIEESVPVEPSSKLIVEDQIQPVAGTASASASLGAADAWAAGLAAFKAAGGTGGTASTITATVGTPQSATINTAFAMQLQATVKDSLNNPVNGVAVTFTAPASGASGTFPGSVTSVMVNTGASGVATAPIFTANNRAGNYTATAKVGAIGPANFSLTNNAGPAANIAATAGTPQSATIGAAFGTALQAKVTDSGGNPVPGVAVTFTAPASGASGTFPGSVTSATVNTDASGVAMAPTFTANGTAGGPYMVTANAGAIGPANFSLTNVAVPPANIIATAGSGQSTTIGTAFGTALQAKPTDSGGNPVSGVAVTFTAPASGASGTFPGSVTLVMVNTDASGVATAPIFTANNSAGNYRVTAKAGAIGPANFSLTNNAGPAANIAATAGTPQSATIGGAFGTALQAKVTDSGGNPVPGVAVTFTAPASGASGTFPGSLTSVTVNTDATGVATAPTFTANSLVGGPYNVTASVAGVTTAASFSLTNFAPTTGGIALVQHTSKDAGSTTSSSLAFNANNTAGNWIAVAIRAGNSSSQVFAVSDSNGNTYHQAIQFGQTVSGNTLGIFYAENIKGGANTVTVSDTVSSFLRIAILEYSGVATSNSLDVTATAQGNSVSPNSGSATTTANGDLLLGAVLTYNPASFTAGSNYTIEEGVPAEPNSKLIAEDQIQLAARTASASASLGVSDNWAAGLAAFRAASSGPRPPIMVSVSPTSVSLPTGTGVRVFQATVQGDVQQLGVTFSLSGAGCGGSACGTLTNVTSTAATYSTPATVPNPATVALTVTSVADITKTAQATITVTTGSPISPVVIENQQPGSIQWQLGNLYGRPYSTTAHEIKGYASAVSVNKGQNITFYVSVNPAQTYTIDVYRIGWYQGLGGRLMQHIGPLNGVQQTDPCPTDALTGLIECNWTPSYTLATLSSWTSGVYVAVLGNAQGFYNYMIFTVRDDSRVAALLYQQPVTTYQAYNGFDGKSLYELNSSGANTVAGTPRAVKVSFDRPYGNGSGSDGAGTFFQLSEINTLRWLEKSGYDVTYSTDLDTHTNGGRLLNFRGFLSLPHDEYWSKPMYDAVTAARDAGVNLGFFGANSIFWQVRFEASSSGVANRVMVCYKDATLDPITDPSLTTVEWRQGPVNRPEQTLAGVMFTDGPNNGSAPYVVTNSANWVYAGTGFRDGDSVPGIVGYEADRFISSYPPPIAVGGTYTLLSHSPYTGSQGPDYSNSSIYQALSGAWVFASGTHAWGWGLDNFYPEGTVSTVDARLQQATTNILNRFLGQ